MEAAKATATASHKAALADIDDLLDGDTSKLEEEEEEDDADDVVLLDMLAGAPLFAPIIEHAEASAFLRRLSRTITRRSYPVGELIITRTGDDRPLRNAAAATAADTDAGIARICLAC